jgi:hypothetical protein
MWSSQGLQDRGRAEINHAGGDHHHVGGVQLVQQRLSPGHRLRLAGGALVGRQHPAFRIVGVDVGQGLGREVVDLNL